LAPENIIEERKPYSEFINEYVEIPITEAEQRRQEMNKKRLVILYQSTRGGIYLVGSKPDVPLDEVNL